MDKKDFIATLAPFAIQARKDGSPLFPSVRLAQNLLETGGKIDSHNNLGGFKVGGGKPNGFWKGDTYITPTWEVVGGKRIETDATWRSYSNVHDFYRDQDLLFAKPRYDRVRAAKTPNEQAEMLYKCGYATDPSYSSKIKALMLAYNLSQYDRGEDDYVMKPEDANKVIADYLKPAYSAAAHKGDKDAVKEIGRLADELRKASGQKIQNA